MVKNCENANKIRESKNSRNKTFNIIAFLIWNIFKKQVIFIPERFCDWEKTEQDIFQEFFWYCLDWKFLVKKCQIDKTHVENTKSQFRNCPWKSIKRPTKSTSKSSVNKLRHYCKLQHVASFLPSQFKRTFKKLTPQVKPNPNRFCTFKSLFVNHKKEKSG